MGKCNIGPISANRHIPSDESLEQGRNRSRELHFTAEQPDKPYLASVGNSLASGPPPHAYRFMLEHCNAAAKMMLLTSY